MIRAACRAIWETVHTAWELLGFLATSVVLGLGLFLVVVAAATAPGLLILLGLAMLAWAVCW